MKVTLLLSKSLAGLHNKYLLCCPAPCPSWAVSPLKLPARQQHSDKQKLGNQLASDSLRRTPTRVRHFGSLCRADIPKFPFIFFFFLFLCACLCARVVNCVLRRFFGCVLSFVHRDLLKSSDVGLHYGCLFFFRYFELDFSPFSFFFGFFWEDFLQNC